MKSARALHRIAVTAIRPNNHGLFSPSLQTAALPWNRATALNPTKGYIVLNIVEPAESNSVVPPAPEPRPSRAEINKQNAQNSAGPISVEGKARSSQNAYKTGICARTLKIAEEDIPHYEHLLNELVSWHKPVGSREMDLVERMRAARWRIELIETQQYEVLMAASEANGHPSNFDGTIDSTVRQFERMDAAYKRHDTLMRYKRHAQREVGAYAIELNHIQELRREDAQIAADRELMAQSAAAQIRKNEPTPGPKAENRQNEAAELGLRARQEGLEKNEPIPYDPSNPARRDQLGYSDEVMRDMALFLRYRTTGKAL